MKPKSNILSVKFFLLSFYGLIFINLSAQIPTTSFDYPYTMAGIHSYLNFNSNVINKPIYLKFLNGGEISRQAIDNSLDQLIGQNRAGYDFINLMYFKESVDSMFGKYNGSRWIGVRTFDHLDIGFSDDLYKLLFLGNQPFKGKELKLSPLSVTQLTFKELIFGIEQEIIRNERLVKQGISFSVISGNRYWDLWSDDLSFYTSSTGDSLVLKGRIMHSESDSLARKYFSLNGWGIGTSFFTEIPLTDCDIIRIGMDGFGYVFWNKNSLNYQWDSTLTFTGFHLGKFNSIEDSVSNQIRQYEDNAKFLSSKNLFGTLLPAFFNFSYNRYVARNFEITAGLQLRIMANYKPFIYLRPSYFIKQDFVAHFNISHGGYGGWIFGINLEKKFKNRWIVTLGSQNLPGIFSPNGYGFHYQAGIRWMVASKN
ncbi:MAG: hypothetical protein KatS3mg034_1768 [Vicingaceae bacterium]|nr:MAG: hypothetical protein KatS3mg034_1768 [Vicingaceae bacterium]